MNPDKILTSTAMLTAIFEKSRCSNINLMHPFVLKIISDNNGCCDDDLIIKKMMESYCFIDFPHAVLTLIINKMKKDKYIELRDKSYFILSKSKVLIDDFDRRYENAKADTKKINDKLFEYLKENVSFKITYDGVRMAFASFLDKYGYMLYNNYESAGNIRVRKKDKDKLHFFIGKFIVDEYHNNSEIFNILEDIIIGLFLSNVIYLQIEVNPVDDLSGLSCYFDTPFLLRLIDFKDAKDNLTAHELVDLLKMQNAKIKCFRHSFDEVRGILLNYIQNRFSRTQVKTLEGLDVIGYNDTELNSLYVNLESEFKEAGITIEEKPDYEKNKYKENPFEDQIDEKKLRSILIERYSNKEIEDRVIDNDIDSVSAILRLRRGKKVDKFEKCNSIFITSNYDIRIATNQLLKIDERIEIGPVVSDIDLTAIVWLRTLRDNPNMPQEKLIENARAALKPTPEIIKEFNDSLNKIKSSKYIKDGTSLQALIYTSHFASQFMNEIEGSAANVNPSLIKKVYEETLKESEVLKEDNKKRQIENDDLVKKLLEKDQKIENVKKAIIDKYSKKISFANKVLSKWIRKIITGIVICIFIFCLIIFVLDYFVEEIQSPFILYILAFLGAYSMMGDFFPIANIHGLGTILGKIIYTWLFPKINGYYKRKEEMEIYSLLGRDKH